VANPLDAILHEITHDIPGVSVAAVVAADGTPIAQTGRETQYLPEHLAAIAASLLGLSQTATTTFGRGDLAQVVVRGEHGYLLLMAIGRGATLAMLTSAEIELGYLLYEIRRQVERLRAVVPLAA
jgi:predicted regulator of Ras-like GTPase activity (Roadblock/LC7/MglB family)